MSALTPIRIPVTETSFGNLVYALKQAALNPTQQAMLVDELYDCGADNGYMDYGSVDLNDIAGRMLNEISNRVDDQEEEAFYESTNRGD